MNVVGKFKLYFKLLVIVHNYQGPSVTRRKHVHRFNYHCLN